MGSWIQLSSFLNCSIGSGIESLKYAVANWSVSSLWFLFISASEAWEIILGSSIISSSITFIGVGLDAVWTLLTNFSFRSISSLVRNSVEKTWRNSLFLGDFTDFVYSETVLSRFCFKDSIIMKLRFSILVGCLILDASLLFVFSVSPLKFAEFFKVVLLSPENMFSSSLLYLYTFLIFFTLGSSINCFSWRVGCHAIWLALPFNSSCSSLITFS